MPLPALLLTSFELPIDPAELSFSLGDPDVLTGLGPILTGETLTVATEALAEGYHLSILNYLGPGAWNLLCNPKARDSALSIHLRPMACGVTELMLSDHEISQLEHNSVYQDRVLERYSENILYDFQQIPSYPQGRIRSGFWSRVRRSIVWCAPRERSLTPPFGNLYHELNTRSRK